MEALHILTGAAWSYSILCYTTLHCTMQCTLLYWTVALAMDKDDGDMVVASLTCEVTFCLCQLMHHSADNHNPDSHTHLTDSVHQVMRHVLLWVAASQSSGCDSQMAWTFLVFLQHASTQGP